jgi:hypothetical protein
MATSCWYVVIESRGKYWVDCEGRALGPYDEIADATDGAVRLAEMFGDPARQLLVMVPDGLGHFDVAWEQDAVKSPEH